MSHAAAAASPVATSAAEPAQTAALDRALVRGIAWGGALRWGSQLVAWVATLIVARALAPADYGLYAMASMFLGLITLLGEFGIGTAVVTLRDLADDQVAQINSLAVMFGIAAFGVSCAAAVPVARFFRAARLPPVVIALSSAFVVTSFRTVPSSLLQKELRFKLLAFVDGAQTLVTALGMVVFALYRLRYWTFVLGGLLGATVSTMLVLTARRHRFAWPRLQSLQHAIAFSQHIVVSRLGFYLYSTADLLVAGKMLGHHALGAYSLASTLATTLPNKIAALMMSVTPTIFSTVQDQSAALRRYLLSLTEGIALITFPAMLGLAVVAGWFVPVVLGDKWRDMIAPLQVLAVYAAYRSIAPLLAQVLNVVGEARFVMRTQIFAALLLPLAFYVGSGWGATGIAIAWTVAHPVVSLLMYRRAFRGIGVSARQYLAALLPALSGSLVMLIAIWTVDRTSSRSLPTMLHLGVQVLTGIVAYVLSILILQRRRMRSFYQTWSLLRT